jgi:hypothetical protein
MNNSSDISRKRSSVHRSMQHALLPGNRRVLPFITQDFDVFVYQKLWRTSFIDSWEGSAVASVMGSMQMK